MADSDKKKKRKRPSAEKRDIQNSKRRMINKAFISKLRTSIRSFEESLKTSNMDAIKERLNAAYSLLDNAVKRNLIKLNAASRKKSRLAAKAAAKNA